MNQLRCLTTAVLALLLAACVSQAEKKTRAFSNARTHIDVTLSGEWVAPHDANLYLLFKPEPDQDHSGRFGGIDEYDRYRITSKLEIGGNVEVELLSSRADSEMLSEKVTIKFGANYRTLTLTRQPEVPGRPARTALYEKVRD